LQSALDELNPDAADEDRFRTRINEWTSGVSEDT